MESINRHSTLNLSRERRFADASRLERLVRFLVAHRLQFRLATSSGSLPTQRR